MIMPYYQYTNVAKNTSSVYPINGRTHQRRRDSGQLQFQTRHIAGRPAGIHQVGWRDCRGHKLHQLAGLWSGQRRVFIHSNSHLHHAISQRFGIASKAEALSYLKHDILGPRLRECTELLLASPGSDIGSILGYPDDLKFRSCMTLFAAVAPEEQIFKAALDKFFGGAPDALTLKLLRK